MDQDASTSRREDTPAVVVVHPGRQHAYEAVLAAQQADMLQQFVTGFFWGKRDTLETLAHSIAGSRALEVRYLRRRWHAEIDPMRVTTFPLWHLIARPPAAIIGRMPHDFRPNIDHWADVLFDRWVSRWLRGQPAPKIVHGFEGAALHSLRTAHNLGMRTVLDVPSAHEYLIEQYNIERGRQGKLVRLYPWRRIAAERAVADLLLAPSAHVAECLAEHGVRRDRIALLPFGVDVARFCARPPQATVEGNRFRVLFVGRASLGKGVQYLLEAWKRVALNDAELIIAGGVDDEVQRLAKEGPSNVRWLRQVAFSTVHRLYQSSDVFVLPSLAEGSALVTYEAMASGLPQIVTANAGSVIRDGVDGYVVPVRSSKAIGERLEYLYHHTDLRAQMGVAARQRIVNGYTWQHYRRRLAAAYMALAHDQPIQQAIDRVS